MRALMGRRAAGSEEDFRARLRGFGLDEAAVEAMVAQAAPRPDEEDVEVFAWLRAAVEWFVASASQWRRDAEGRAVGLDYAGAEAAARLAGLEVGPRDFAWLRMMEHAVMDDTRRKRG